MTLVAAVFAMLIGALISEGAAASLNLTFTATFVTLMALLVTMQVGLVWRSGDYRDEELTEFVLWLHEEAAEASQGGGGGEHPSGT